MVAKIKYLAYIASSIDGKIAKSGTSGVDWTSPEDWKFFQKALSKVDVIIVGYNTYKTVEKSIKKRKAIVLSSKVTKPKVEDKTVFFNPEKADLKKFLEGKGYKKVGIVGGAQVYNFCLKNKILDELSLTIEPYVFTAGVPMFFGDVFKKYRFSLKSIKKLNKKGTILLHYTYAN